MAKFVEQEMNFFSFHVFSFYPLSFLIFMILLVKWLSKPRTTQKNLPPTPPKLPILGNLHQLGRFPHRALLSLAQRYGPVMLLQLGSVPTLVISSPLAAEEILKTHDVIFASRHTTTMTDKLLYNSNDVVAAPYGEYWRQLKSICVLHLLNKKRVQSFDAVRAEEVSILVDRILKSGCCSSSPVDLSSLLMKLANDLICRVALGRKYSDGEVAGRFKGLFRDLLSLIGRFSVGEHIPWLAWVDRVNGINAKADRVAKEFDEIVDGVIEQHLDGDEEKKRNTNSGNVVAEDGHKDFVDVLLQIHRDGSHNSGFTIHRESIKALIFDMFAAGTDTTFSTLEWAMAELLRKPEAMKELQNEVRGITKGRPDHETIITPDDLEEMHYLKAVIKETLRLHPPAPFLFPRKSSQNAKIMGYDVAAGTMVLVNVWAIARDPVFWDEPNEFIPERFMESNVDFRGQFFQLLPFGAGRRICPGMTFASAAMELVLANLMNKFDWALPDGEDVVDMTERPGFLVHKNTNLFAVAIPRS